MIIYLAGFKTIEKTWNKSTEDIYILSSFWEHKNGKYGNYVLQDRHILDSGAFTAINDKKERYKNYDWNLYCKKYIEFIKETKQKLFFELDIDCIVGLKKVEYLRKMIEDGTGIQPIPCWHSNRGSEYWLKCCEEYPYVAIGTTNANSDGKKIRNNPKILHWFIDSAHKKGTKIHGLGFTSINWLKELKFDSVDSTTWNVGGKYGNLVVFDKNGYPSQKYKSNKNKKAKTIEINNFNFEQWVKFQKYAINNL